MVFVFNTAGEKTSKILIRNSRSISLPEVEKRKEREEEEEFLYFKLKYFQRILIMIKG